MGNLRRNTVQDIDDVRCLLESAIEDTGLTSYREDGHLTPNTTWSFYVFFTCYTAAALDNLGPSTG